MRLESAGFTTMIVVADGVNSGNKLAENLGIPFSPKLQALWVACDRYAELTAAVASRDLSVEVLLTVPLETSAALLFLVLW